MPVDEGMALYEAALLGGARGPLLEVGSYCGKSAVYLGAAARARSTVVFSIDHHRGSEEHQPGEEYHDPALRDEAGRVDTLPEFRRTIARAGLDDVVIGIIGSSPVVASQWGTPLGLVFIDGSHSQSAADADLDGWSPWVVSGGLLAIHDVFEDPSDGGRPPYEIFRRALGSGAFKEAGQCRSLRVLERVRDDL
ncbi:MAG: class I SAM-dependent methyltransferase [Actinomycetota bacterium]|nr:class I SAM-dependent methyltransferase [Actinomycetota bacterium]